MKFASACVATFTAVALATFSSNAQAQLGATRAPPKPQSGVKYDRPSRCVATVGRVIQPDDFKTAFAAISAQPGQGPKSQYETQRQYEDRIRRNPSRQLLLSRPFRGRYRAEEQRFELWYHDLMGKGPFSTYDTDRYITLSKTETSFSSGLGTRSRDRLTIRSTTTYDIELIDLTGPRPKRRAFNFPFTPEFRLKPPSVGLAARSGIPARAGSSTYLNRMRWYLDMPGAEAQANDQSMRWVYQIEAKSALAADGVSNAPGSINAKFYDQRIINGRLSCAMIIDRSGVVKKVFRAQ